MERDDDGLDGIETLKHRAISAPAELEDVTSTLDGYAFGDAIGEGGIGEVIAAHDLRVGRDVAIKRLKAKHPTLDAVNRFLREARIQARLDHPAIPPVHELGKDSAGRPFFAMKRLIGVTLSDRLGIADPNRNKLLRAFVEVCQAIEFAHSRGVVHRDLKPGNIMIGDYGDVYVLDWGLSRVVGEAVTEMVNQDLESVEITSGELLGTPGYMAPEQLLRDGDTGRPADVYALGAILFEILAGEPLHPRGQPAVQSTIGGTAVTSPAKRRPDRGVAPELDAVCIAMLGMDPATRPTARRVAERVGAYLDGDRDVARRKTMAVDLVWVARAALHEGRRAEAMRSAGRALALDPESTGAAELIASLLLEPPAQPPPELAHALVEADSRGVRRHARTAILAYATIAAFLPIAMWNGVRNWGAVIGVFVIACTMGGAAYAISRRPERSFAWMVAYALGNVLLMALITRMAGPFTFVPALTCVVIMSVMAYPVFIERAWLLIGMVAIGFMVPIALEALDVIGRTWEIRGGALVSHAGALAVEGSRTLTMVILASVATIVIAGIHAHRIYRNGREANRQLVMQAWHLHQLLPSTPPPA